MYSIVTLCFLFSSVVMANLSSFATREKKLDKQFRIMEEQGEEMNVSSIQERADEQATEAQIDISQGPGPLPKDPAISKSYRELIHRLERLDRPGDEALTEIGREVREFAEVLEGEEPFFAAQLLETWGKVCRKRLSRPDMAIGPLVKAKELYNALGKERHSASLFLELAGSFFFNSRFSEALVECDNAEKWLMEKGIEYEPELAAIVHLRGAIYSRLSRFDEALAEFDSVGRWYEKSRDEKNLAQVEHARGNVYAMLSQFDNAIKAYNRATALFEKLEYEKGLVDIAVDRGNVYLGLSRFDEALAEYDLAAEWYGKVGDEQGLVTVILNRAAIYVYLFRLNEALAGYGRANAWFEKVGDQRGLAIVAANRGRIFTFLARFKDALSEYDRAAQWYEEAGDEGALAGIAEGRGTVYLNVFRFEDALAEYDRAAAWYEQISDEVGLAGIAWNRGSVYWALSRFEDALDEYNRAAELYHRIGDERKRVMIAINRGGIHSDRSRFEDALKEFDYAAAWFEKFKNEEGRSVVAQSRGVAYMNLARFEDAMSEYDRAEAFYKKIGREVGIAEIAENRSVIYSKLSRFEDALSSAAEAVKFYKIVLNNQVQETGAESSESFRAAYFDLPNLCLDIYQELLQSGHARAGEALTLTYQAMQTVYGLGVSEALGKRSGADLLVFLPKERERLSNLDREIARGAAELRRLRRSGKTEETYEASLHEYRAILKEREKLFDSVRSRNPVAIGFACPVPAHIEEVQAALPENTALIEYVLSENRVFCAVTSNGTTEIVDLGEPQGLVEYIRMVAGFFGNTNLGALRSLGERLLDPALSRINLQESPRPRSLLLSLQGQSKDRHGEPFALCQIPFEILLTGEPKSNNGYASLPYLIRDYDVAYVHSGTVFRDMRKQAEVRKPIPKDALDFVAMAFPFDQDARAVKKNPKHPRSNSIEHIWREESRRPLYESANEVLDVAKLFTSNAEERQQLARVRQVYRENRNTVAVSASEVEGKRFRLLLRKRANETVLKNDEQVRNARILHLGCHGKLDTVSPTLSGLILALSDELERETGDDGYVYVSELMGVSLNVELLVLAACNSSAGMISLVEGHHSLSRAGLVAGSRSVISTLWEVNDKHSRTLMTDFYRNWILKGHSRVHALAEAKRKAIREGMPIRTWAAYILWDAET